MNGLEIAYLRADLLSRELMMNTDISTQFIVAPLMDPQKKEGKPCKAKMHRYLKNSSFCLEPTSRRFIDHIFSVLTTTVI